MSDRTDATAPAERRRPLVSHGHRKRSLTPWLIPLAVIIGVMILLPRLAAVLGD